MGLTIRVTSPSAPEILLVTTISGKVLPEKSPETMATGFCACAGFNRFEQTSAEINVNRNGAGSSVSHGYAAIGLLEKISNDYATWRCAGG